MQRSGEQDRADGRGQAEPDAKRKSGPGGNRDAGEREKSDRRGEQRRDQNAGNHRESDDVAIASLRLFGRENLTIDHFKQPFRPHSRGAFDVTNPDFSG